MHGKKVKFFIEIIIHALLWLGVYYALQALTDTSFKMYVNDNGRILSVDGRHLYPYSRMTVGLLMLLFYGSIFWLFRKVMRFKSRLLDMAIITGWLLLLYALNYETVWLLMPPARNIADQHKLTFDFNGLPGSSPQLPSSLHPPLPSPPPPVSFSVNDWNQMQPVMGAIFLAILSIAVAYFFIREAIRNDLKRSQMEAQQLSTEIRFLRSQINPHFLFNTLNNLFSMAQRSEDEELADGILKLSGMMRYMIYESNTDVVSLEREIAYLEDCIALNKLRYADSEVSIDFRYPGTARAQVAPMLFVPFVENAFKHGVSIGDHSSITIVMEVDGQQLNFTCENTDHSAVKGTGGVGLENVRRRLELLYPGRYVLRVGPEGGKYKVNLQIELT